MLGSHIPLTPSRSSALPDLSSSVGPNGELSYVGEEWTRGNHPRSFGFDPAGQFLYRGNQRGDNIAAIQVDHKAGGLGFTGRYTAVGNPSWIVFLDLAKVG